MNRRAFRVFPGSHVTSVEDTTAVLLSTGVMSLGLTVGEARDLSTRLARAADDVEHQLSERDHVVTRDAREFFEAEQCPSDRNFGR